MNVYKVGPDLAFGQLVYTSDSIDHAQAMCWLEAAGTPRAADWQPPPLESPRGGPKVLPLDCVGAAAFAGHSALLGARARELLAPLLLPCGEYLPVRLDGLDYCWFNCTTVADIANQDGIEGELWEHDNELPSRWKEIDRWSFHPECVATAPTVFTVPQRGTLMCTDVLRRAVEAHDLLGFRFDLLWSPEDGGVTIDNSLSQFFGEFGRQMNIAAKERRKAMQARLKGRLAKAAPTPS